VRCDAIAQGLISVVKSMNLRIPIVARLQGTNMEQAHQLVRPFSLFSIYPSLLPPGKTKLTNPFFPDQRLRPQDLLNRRLAERS
jgi:hypothetical protein